MSNDQHPLIKAFLTIPVMNAIAIFSSALIMDLLFWKSQTIIDKLLKIFSDLFLQSI